MAEPREDILSRLVTVIGGVDGIADSARNAIDVPGIARPAGIVHDGAEQVLTAPPGETRSRVQLMELRPEVEIRVRADSGAEAGALLTLFRNRIVYAALSDATLRALVGTSGGIRFEGSTVVPPQPESKEPRMLIEFVFTYRFTLTDLA